MRNRHGQRLLCSLALGLALGILAPAAAFADPHLHPTLLAKVSYGAVPPSFARTADGSLHVVYQTNINWGDSANGIGSVTIGASGQVGPVVQALSWGSTAANGIPGVAVMPGGALEAVFGGSPSGDPGPWGISSTDGGTTWSAPADVGSQSMEGGGAMTLQNSNGQPVLTEGCCGGIVVQQGFGPNVPTNLITNGTDGVAGNVDSAVDAATGAVVVSWDSSQAPGGTWLQQVAPTVLPAVQLPIPTLYGTGEPTPIAGRDTGPGVFAAYPSNARNAQTTRISLARFGGQSIPVGSVKGVHVAAWGDATGPDGRIWVFWYGVLANSTGIIGVTRSNKAVTAFEPIQQYRFSWSGLVTLSGDGRPGPLDLLFSGTPVEKTCCATTGIYHSRVLPVLSATAIVKHLKGKEFAVLVHVTDAGDAMPGATVTGPLGSATTNADGNAKIKAAGLSGGHVTLRVSAPTYQPLVVGAEFP